VEPGSAGAGVECKHLLGRKSRRTIGIDTKGGRMTTLFDNGQAVGLEVGALIGPPAKVWERSTKKLWGEVVILCPEGVVTHVNCRGAGGLGGARPEVCGGGS